MSSSTEHLWRAEVRASRRRLALAWWLDRILPAQAVLALLTALAGFLVKGMPGTWELWNDLIILIAASMLFLAVLAAAWLARRRLPEESRLVAHLDERLRLNCALVSAWEGLGPWPDLPDRLGETRSWDWRRIFAPLLASSILLAALAWCPAKPLPFFRGSEQPREIPMAMQEAQRLIESAEAHPELDQKAVAALKQRTEDLLKQPQDSWYSDSFLEAAENLRKGVEAQLAQQAAAAKTLNQAIHSSLEIAAALDAMEEMPLSPEAKDALEKFHDKLNASAREALEQLASSGLPASPELLKKLQDLALDKLGGEIAPGELDALKEALKNLADLAPAELGVLDFDGGDGSGDASAWDNEQGDLLAMLGLKKKDGQPGDGGVDRGPGDGGDPLGDERARLKAAAPFHLKGGKAGQDPGIVIKASKRAPQVDKNAWKGQTDGGSAVAGDGGSDAENSELLPEEAQLLKKFYK
ncbi:MAG: hypothetical protein RL095_577 [Verrucomicrobiota bacterium]|jgi:hypothetical protein